MSSKLKIIFLLICLLISILIIRYLNVDKDFSNLALGEETTTVYAKDVQDRSIHVSSIDSLNKQTILHVWNINGNNLVSSKVLANGNTRKFFYLNNFKENCYHFLSLNIDNIENIKEINLNLRLLTDTGIEKISQKKIGFESPHLLINVEKEFEFIKDLNYGSAIIQLESYDHNINGSFLYCSKDGVVAVDHLTGG
mgnify:CR=1 FL=1